MQVFADIPVPMKINWNWDSSALLLWLQEAIKSYKSSTTMILLMLYEANFTTVNKLMQKIKFQL